MTNVKWRAEYGAPLCPSHFRNGYIPHGDHTAAADGHLERAQRVLGGET